MNGTGFRGRGCIPRGRKPHGLATRIGVTRIPQQNFTQPDRDSHVPPGDFWLEHSSPPPWQQMNGPSLPQPPFYSNFESHRYRGRPPFCTGFVGIRGNGKKIRGEGRPGILPTPGFRGTEVGRPPQSDLLRCPPPLGSEEERQQKIAETADKLKQKLSLLRVGNTANFSEDDVMDVNFSQTEDRRVVNKAKPELKHDPPELDLTVNDFKDIGRVDLDNSANFCDSVGAVLQKISKPEIEVAKNSPNSNPWDDVRCQNIGANAKEPPKTSEKLTVSSRLTQSIECAQGTLEKSRSSSKDSSNESKNVNSDKIAIDSANYAVGYDRRSSTPKLSSELLSSKIEKEKTEAAETIAKETSSDLKPEFNKVREKLREVIKVERQNEKEGTTGPPPDNRTTFFQHATGLRLQPPVRLDFHPGIRPRPQRFQGSPHFRPPFLPEHGIDIRPNFRPDFPPRFNHGQKNFNISPRLQGPQMIPPEFNGRTVPIVGPRQIVDHVELNVQVNFDPREPPPRFNAPIFNPNELPPKFCPPSGLNRFQPPSGFYQHGPPPIFVNQDQNSAGLPASFNPNLGTSSPVAEFSQLVPPSYNQIPPMHCSSFSPVINGGFNPAMPPPNPGSCMIPKFPPPSMPSSASSSTCSSPFTTEAQSIMQLPPMPMNSLEIQPPPPPPPHPPPVPPPPPPSRLLDNVSKSKNERNSSQRNDGVTPNMNDELEDMQEALEFAKQLMSMTNDDTEDDIDRFNMLMFPDLTSITSAKPSHIEQELPTCESENDNSLKQSEIHRLRDVEQGEEFNPGIVREEEITQEELLLVKNEEEQLLLDVQIRPKVIFNVNSRSKKIARINEWQSPNNENSILRHKEPTEKMPDFSTPIAKEGEKRDWENLLSKEGSDAKLSEKRNSQKESQQRRDDNKEQETRTVQDLLGSPIAIEDGNSSHKDIANDVIDQSRKLRGLSSKLSSKSLLTTTVDANWKDKVINQFLKMSKNDICNMVNSSGLRKFDIAMKHLVKERKYSLSQERRSSADDAVKGYDMSREEFMNQLSAMLDPSATVDIKNLPSKFIQHLSDVLKLDVKSHLSDSIESWPAPSSGVTNNMDVNYNNQNNFSDRNNDQNFCELLDPDLTSLTHPGDDDLSVHIKTEVRPTQAIQISSDFSNLFIDTQSDNGSIIVCDNMASTDDIFPAGILKAKLVDDSVTQQVAPAPLEQEKNIDRSSGQFSPYKMIRVKGLTTMQSSQEYLSRGDILTSRTDDEVAAEGRKNFSEDKFQEKDENIEEWNRRKRQDLDMFRNLTKEEWEAKYSGTIEREFVPSQKETSPRSTNSSRSMGFKDHKSNRNRSPYSPLKDSPLKEMNRNAGYICEINDKGDKSSGEKDYNLVTDSDKDIKSNSASRSSEDDRSAPSDVTKLFEVIKSREKIAKNMTIDQIIGEELTAEIELTERRDQEHHRECKIRENERDTRSREPRDKQKWINSSPETDNGIQKDTTRKEVFNEKVMEFEKDEMLNRVGNVEPSENNSNLRGPDEPNEGNFQEQERGQIEFLENSKDIISPVTQEFTCEILPTEALQSNYDKVGEALNEEEESDQLESSTPVENHLDNLELEEIKNTLNDKTEMQLNKPGMKKIDIQAYKARKLQQNNDKQDGKSGEIETVSPSLDSGSTDILHSNDKSENNIKERQNKESSENETGENENECKQKNSSDNVQVTKLKESQQLVNIQNSTRQHSHKERSSAPKSNSERKDERKSRNDTKLDKHQHSERSKEKLYSDEKFDKKRSRNYSRDSHRSESREENRRTSKEKSKRSFQETIRRPKSENKFRSKSPYDKYNSQSKDKKPAKHRASDASKETHEKIDKREKNKIKIVGDRPVHKRSSREHYDAKKKVYRSEPHISDKISANKLTAEDLQQKYDTENDEIAENLTLVIDPTNLEKRNEELPTGVMQTPMKLAVSQVIINESTGSSLRDKKTLENDFLSSKAKDMSDLTESNGAGDSSHFNEEAVTRVNSESINSDDLQANAKSLSLENKDHSVENDSKSCSATEEGVQKLNGTREVKPNNNSDLADTKTESLSHETTEKTKVIQKFNDKIKSNLQPNENEVKLVIENLLQRVISELDLLNQENEDQDGISRGDNAEIMISSPAALELGPEELPECAILDLNSPETPESPLKGFSEETIKNSILGKRKLAQSVLKITEDYIQGKGSKDFNETVSRIVTERDIICGNSEESTSYKNSEDIDALLAANIGSKNFYTDTENSFGDNQECHKEVVCDERRVDEEIEPIRGENEEKTGDATIISEKNETCARSLTPSGDTLSLGSSIDFDNSEFIVLSEISSDENFSQDDERKREATSMLENEEMNTSKLNTKSEIRKETEKTIISSDTSHCQKDDNIGASTIARSTKFETNQSSNELNSISSQMIDSNVPDLTKPCNVDIFSNSSQSELESNQSQNNNPSNAIETTTARILEECKEQPPGENDNSSKNKCMDDGRVSLCCDSIQSNNPRIENVDAKKIFLTDSEADFNKTDRVTQTGRHTESERTTNIDVVSKGNLLPRESNADKHIHRVKRTHKTKHKKDKKPKLDEKKIRESLKDKDLMTVVEKPRTKERVLARMVEIDIEIHKLMSEKIKLLQMIESDILPTEPPKLESVKEFIKKSDSRLPSKENNGVPVKVIKVDAKTKSISSYSRSSKNPTNHNSEDETGNRGNGKEKKTRKKTEKRDRSSSQDNSIPETESKSVSLHKTSSKKYTDTKNTATRKEKSKKYDSSQNSRQRSGGSSSSNSQHEKYTTRTDREVTFAKNSDKATLSKSLFEVCAKSTKIDNHGRSQKKANKISDSRENNILQLKKEVQHCELNDEVKLESEADCKSFNNASGEQLPEICSDESNQKSKCLEQKGMNKNSNGLLLLEESYKRDKMDSKKLQGSFSPKKKKGTLKCSAESDGRALSPSEEELPLQLLYLKKCQKKLEPLKSAESSSRNDKSRILKLKRRRSTEVLKHVMKVIDAVARNQTGECQKTNKVKVKSEGTVHREAEKVRRKEKILMKIKPHPTHMSNRSAASESEDAWTVANIQNCSNRRNYDESFKKCNELDSNKSSVGSLGRKLVMSVHESDEKSSIDKIIDISGEYKEDVREISPFGDFYEENMSEIFHGENETDILSEQWNIAEDETFNYTDDVPQFLDSASDLVPHDPTSRSNSTPCNFHMEKGLDIVDLMLETVGGDFVKTSNDVPICNVQKRKRKRVTSGNKESENDLTVKRMAHMTRSEMMNCSVRLVDCKYTHLKNPISRVCRKSFSSYAQIAKLKGYISSEPNAVTEYLNWSSEKAHLIDNDKIVQPLSTDPLTGESDLKKNSMEEKSENTDNDLEIIESRTPSGLQFQRGENGFLAGLTEAGNAKSLIQKKETGVAVTANGTSDFSLWNQSKECDEEATVILETQGNTSFKSEVNTSAARKQLTEYGLRAKPLSKLVDPEIHNQETNAKEIDDIEDQVEVLRNNVTEEKLKEQHTDTQETCDVQIINQIETNKDDEVQEVELPLIQYSVHKGPILDLKVFGDSILAASEDGVIYRYSQTCNGILNSYEGHKEAVTCMYVLEVDAAGTPRDWLFSGSLDRSLRCYNIKTSMQVRDAADVGSSIQCMDQSWGVIFIGTKSGYVSRFHIKADAFRGDEIKFSEEAVLGLKATTEGPRRVLIVASRNQPITIRDAQNGLLIRTINGHKSHTVYSLLMDSNLVYCGTSSTAIPVFDFINGSEIKLYNAGPGIVCMRMYKRLLFAGCYDGNIYVFDTKEQKIVCSIPGPGNMLLSMDIVGNKIVAGSKDRRLHMWQMPEQVQLLLAART